jgi:curved DNA-binding protein CbpA
VSKTHYEVLGVAETATIEQIKLAFRARAKECHPDVNGGSDASANEFKLVNSAYETLSDQAKRAAYDAELFVVRSRAAAIRAAASAQPPSPGTAAGGAAPPQAPPTPTWSWAVPPTPAPRATGPTPGQILGTVLAGMGLAALFGAAFGGSSSTWDSSVGRRRGPDGRFVSG